MNAACVAFTHPSLHLRGCNRIKDPFSTVPSFHLKQKEQ